MMVMWITIRLPDLPGTMVNFVYNLHCGKEPPVSITNVLLLISGGDKIGI